MRLDTRTVKAAVHVMAAVACLLGLCLVPSVAQDNQVKQRYVLGQGDKLRVIVFEEPDLSGEFIVDDFGTISLPLIGEVEVGALDIRGAERLIEARLMDGFLKRPRVNIEVLNFRPFYILGEVNSPGEYEFVGNMTILKAVALAGGFTYRANKSGFVIIRGKDPERKEAEVDADTLILPGDIVRVKERFF